MTQILEIIHHISHAQTETDLRRILCLTQQLIPCDKIVAATGSLPITNSLSSTTGPVVTNLSYPIDWLNLYAKRHYAKHDPVIQTWIQTEQTFTWQHAIQKNMPPQTQEVLEEARHYGICNGIISGKIDHIQKTAAFVAYAGGSHRDTLRYSGIIDYLSRQIATLLLRIHPSTSHKPNLSEREQEVIAWIKEGLTSKEIAAQLHISERTVRFHVQRLLSKLHAKTRAQAIENYYANSHASHA